MTGPDPGGERARHGQPVPRRHAGPAGRGRPVRRGHRRGLEPATAAPGRCRHRARAAGHGRRARRPVTTPAHPAHDVRRAGGRRPGRRRRGAAPARAGRCRTSAPRCATRARHAATSPRASSAPADAGLRLHRSRTAVRPAPPRRLPLVPRSATRRRRGVRADAVLGPARRGACRARARAVGGLRAGAGRAGRVVPVRRPAAARRRHHRPARRSWCWPTRCRGPSARSSARSRATGSHRASTSPSTSSSEWRSPWVLAHNRARHAERRLRVGRHGHVGLRPRLPLDEPRLVAYATQVFLFTFPG